MGLVPRLRRSDHLGIESQPFRAGLTFGGRPSPGFPVELGGFGELHAPFFMERRTRGSLQCSVAGNPGPGLASVAILQRHFFLNLPQASRVLGMTKEGFAPSSTVCDVDGRIVRIALCVQLPESLITAA